jgi:hypothetical protein
MKRTKKNKRNAVATAKRGKPVARFATADEKPGDIYNFFASNGRVLGDVISPALSPEEWGELKYSR